MISKMALRWHREETNCWIKSLFLFFFAYKKYSRCIIKFRMNHWWQMDYSDDAFLGLDSVIYLAVNGSHKPPDFHPKYLKMCTNDEGCTDMKILGWSRRKLNTGTEGRIRFFTSFLPHDGLFKFFSQLHKLNSQNLLFTLLSCFTKK